MIVLALDTTTSLGSVALLDGAVTRVWPGASARTHAERLPMEAVSALAECGRTLHDVDLFAVVSGPGSFTGVRVGLACVQGWAFASGKPAIAIPTLDAVLTTWLMTSGPRAGETLVISCIDGQRGEVFFSVAAVPRDARWPEACVIEVAPAVARPEDLAALIAQCRGGRATLLVGDGAVRYASVLAAPGIQLLPAGGPLAGAAVELAERRASAAGPPHALQPTYVRRPDAELARERARRAPHGG